MSDPIGFRGPQATLVENGRARFDSMRTAFSVALERHPIELVEEWIGLAGRPVRVRVVGRVLAERLLRAFGHLVVTPTNNETPSLSIEVWDEFATSIPAPTPVGTIDGVMDGDERGLILKGATDRIIGFVREGSQLWMDRGQGRVLGSVTDGKKLSLQNRGKPFHVPLLLWLMDRGIPVVHGALVSVRSQGVLLVGPGGAGKTTAALACLLNGFRFSGDDYVAVERRSGWEFRGHSLYDCVWLTQDGVDRFPQLAPYVEKDRLGEGLKHLLHARGIHPDRLLRAVSIRAIVTTTLLDGPEAAIRPSGSAKALLSMAPSSALQLPVSGDLLVQRMAELAEHTPCYEVGIGQEPMRLPALLHKLLRPEGQR